YLEQIQQLSDNIYSNADVYSMLHENSLTTNEHYRIFLFLKSLKSLSPKIEIYQIYLDLYSMQESYIIGQNGSSFGPSRYHIHVPDSVKKGSMYGEGPHLSSNYGFSISGAGTPVYTFHRKLYDSSHRQELGTISFDVEVSALQEYLFQNNTIYGYLVQDDGEIVISNSPVSLNDRQTAALLATCAETGWADLKFENFSGLAFAQNTTIDDFSLYVIRMIPYSELYAQCNRLLLNSMVILFSAAALCCLTIFLAVRRVIKPMRDLNRYVGALHKQGFRNGPPCRREDYVNYPYNDELGNLIVHTEQTFSTLYEMFERQKQLNQATRTAEAKMLQAQINPHFLYNSLQSLASLALQHGDKDTWRYITMLGSMMQYSMNLERATAPLRQEFEHVRAYITLQNVRFENQLTTEFMLDREAEDILVPKVILQPLAGNAYKHGQLCHRENSRFSLRARLLSHCLIIEAENTGDTCAPERIAEVNACLKNESVSLSQSGDSGIGLPNVLHRLRLFYGPEVSMKLSALPGGGTAVHICIPL
ncbi:MAG: histidine kinase, partial [Subdoligranulum sp.]|nr:histidine kinase [Subdoligranulum sp.]